MRKNLIPFLILLCALGCASIYTSTVTITSVVDTTMRAWAELSVAGKTTPAIDARVITAHNRYRLACESAQDALKLYRATGNVAGYTQSVSDLKTAAAGILEPLTPLLAPTRAAQIQHKLDTASIP